MQDITPNKKVGSHMGMTLMLHNTHTAPFPYNCRLVASYKIFCHS